MTIRYPYKLSERRKWIEDVRPERNEMDPWRPYAWTKDKERTASGQIVESGAIFLTNRECPWRCLMCDLWKNTLNESVPIGVIPEQIRYGLDRLGNIDEIKLYNSGSFFDHKAIPKEDYMDIAKQVAPFNQVIVESHPSLIGDDCLLFRDMLSGNLEVAMGLETVHPEVLEKLNKGITLDSFRRAADFLSKNGIDLRVFILVRPPFMSEEEGLEWACRSLDFADEVGASVSILIPTRGGNGAMERLREQGDFEPPKLHTLEKALDYGISNISGRVFADLWDLEQFSDCPVCFEERKKRLEEINLTQGLHDYPQCGSCLYHEEKNAESRSQNSGQVAAKELRADR